MVKTLFLLNRYGNLLVQPINIAQAAGLLKLHSNAVSRVGAEAAGCTELKKTGLSHLYMVQSSHSVLLFRFCTQ